MKPKNNFHGLTLVEVVVATALLMIITSGLVSLTQLSVRSAQAARVRAAAGLVLNETMEEVMAVRASNFSNLSEGEFHPELAGGKWILVSGQEETEGVKRWVTIAHVQRQVSCAGQRVCPIVASGGVVDPVTFRAKVYVEWQELGDTKQESLESILTFWR